ncbi:MAG TPA: helix-turn-helix domain-containing protein [Burkholderiales bacterium]
MQENPEAAAEALPGGASASAGAALKAARERMALSVGDAARHLRLSVRQVDAMESGEFARLPDEPFLSGFVRNYARLVQIDPEPLLEDIRGQLPPPQARELLGQQSPEVAFPTGRERPWGRYAAWGALGILALGLLAYEGLQEYRPSRVEAQKAATAPPQVKPAAPPAPVLEAVGQPAPQAAAQPVPEGAAAAAPALRALVMTFSAPSWVEVRDRDGQLVFSQVSPAGSTQSVTGNPPLAVVLGNAAGVRVSFGDRAVDLAPHTRENVARFTLE